jgi:hypothetical protein
MGARAYIIKEVERNKFIAVYNHWGAEYIREFVGKKEELYAFLTRMWQESYDEERKTGNPLIHEIKGVEELERFLYFRDIGIEVWAIIFLSGKIEVFITLIRNFVNGAIRVNRFETPYKLRWAFGAASCIETVLDFLQALDWTKERAENDIKRGFHIIKNKYHSFEGFDLIVGEDFRTAVENNETLPLEMTILY